MVVVFLGAGFSSLGGVPLASELFAERPIVDRIVRERLVERVLDGWFNWNSEIEGTPEQYLSHLEQNPGQQWRDAQWYVALNVTLHTRGVKIAEKRSEVIHHSLELSCSVEEHKQFWTAIFQRTENVTVITTNYDMLAEQGLRPTPTPRAKQPGFHYGAGPEKLEGSVPGIFHKKAIEIKGSVPLLKLHGSVSWEYANHGLVRFHDCRPAIKGTAAIIAPSTEKSIPREFKEIWEKAETSLHAAANWIIVGYSFPEYDHAINDLLRRSSEHGPGIHILNPDETVATRVKQLFTKAEVRAYTGLPGALSQIPSMLS